MGVTGTGKSYFIKEVSGISDVEVSSSLHSCTTKAQPYSFPYEGVKVTLVDTPGFNDSTKSDTEVLTNICAWISVHYEKEKLLSGIIYLHRVTDVRMDGSSMKYLKMFRRFCGSDALENVLLTTTHWSNIAQEQGESREGELRKGEFWGGLIAEGAAVARFTGTRESGLELIRKLIVKKPKPLHIQNQLVDEGMKLVETDVGKFMNAELISLQNKYERDLEELEKERQKAIEEKDGLMEEILAEEQAKAQRKLKEAEAEKKLLVDLHEVMRKCEEVERRKGEEEDKNGSAVIAVASKDISITAHIISLVKPYSTKGRLIYDIDEAREFEKDPFDITINYQANISSIPDIVGKTMAEFFDAGVSNNNYIIYNHAQYWSRPGGPIRIGTQSFHIFTKF